VEALGASRYLYIGNGRNDRLMLAAAAVGIAVVQAEGAAVETLLAADVAAPHIQTALGLLLNPGRLVATLRL
jgi:soluble P-type ATPase